MTPLPHLRPEDRADFEWVLNLALDVTDVRSALEQGSTAPDRHQLRARAWASATEIAGTAADEYRAYRRARAAVTHVFQDPGEPSRPPTSPGAGVLLPAVAVLVPLLSAIAGVVFLFLRYGIQLATPESRMASLLVTAGWISALISVVTTAMGLGGLLTTALRRRATPTPPLIVHNPAAEQARNAWQQALLERGMLPYLRQQLSANPPRPQ
ncbi:hypothetical protein [Streptomyces alboflavus]|uniref:hypothetical protein n=1 Tax=Streptomyces alboflavus TaxID=67267 RepID=UPI0036BC00FB